MLCRWKRENRFYWRVIFNLQIVLPIPLPCLCIPIFPLFGSQVTDFSFFVWSCHLTCISHIFLTCVISMEENDMQIMLFFVVLPFPFGMFNLIQLSCLWNNAKSIFLAVISLSVFHYFFPDLIQPQNFQLHHLCPPLSSSLFLSVSVSYFLLKKSPKMWKELW